MMSQPIPRPLVVAHRGVDGGTIVENTIAAATFAFRSGADMVEFDVTRSSDGEFFVFHDGLEPKHFQLSTNLQELTAAQVAELRYFVDGAELADARVETVRDFLTHFRGTEALFNVDRSWPWWETFLPLLDELDMADQLLLKAPASHPGLGLLADHPVAYPFMPICTTLDQVYAVLECDGLNTVGVELLAHSPDSELLTDEAWEFLRASELLLFVNAENLNSSAPLFVGWDDNASVLDSPDAGWGKLLNLGATAIQTDWPALLRSFVNAQCALPPRSFGVPS